MDANEAIGILRGDVSPSSVLHPWIADRMGADALEAWEWVGQEEHNVLCNIKRKRWEVDSGVRIIGHGPTPLAAVLDAMDKEGKG